MAISTTGSNSTIPATNAVDLAGYYLTDALTNKFKYLITTNGPHIIPPQGLPAGVGG